MYVIHVRVSVYSLDTHTICAIFTGWHIPVRQTPVFWYIIHNVGYRWNVCMTEACSVYTGCSLFVLQRHWGIYAVIATRFLKYTFISIKIHIEKRMTGQWGLHWWGLNAPFTAASLAINQSGMNDLSNVILPPMCLPITSAAWPSPLVHHQPMSQIVATREGLQELASQIRGGIWLAYNERETQGIMIQEWPAKY